MSDDRSPRSHALLAFLLLCSPVGILLAIVFGPFALTVLVSFFGTLILFWAGARAFTNLFVKLFDPEGYEKTKESGGDPFYDSLGAPLNFDSDEVRRTGHEPNSLCPNCQKPIYVEEGQQAICHNCGYEWD